MTKKVRYTLLFLTLSTMADVGFSQIHILSTIDNIVYQEVGNTLTINLTENECKKLVFKTDNGIIERQGCDAYLTPKHPGAATVEIFKIMQGKKIKIGESTFRVRPLPDPYARFAGRTGGKISKEEAIVNGGLICYFPSLICEPPAAVDRYTVIIVKGGDTLLLTQNKGARFDSSTTAILKKLDRGNLLIFSQIIVYGPDKIRKRINPIEFIIE